MIFKHDPLNPCSALDLPLLFFKEGGASAISALGKLGDSAEDVAKYAKGVDRLSGPQKDRKTAQAHFDLGVAKGLFTEGGKAIPAGPKREAARNTPQAHAAMRRYDKFENARQKKTRTNQKQGKRRKLASNETGKSNIK